MFRDTIKSLVPWKVLSRKNKFDGSKRRSRWCRVASGRGMDRARGEKLTNWLLRQNWGGCVAGGGHSGAVKRSLHPRLRARMGNGSWRWGWRWPCFCGFAKIQYLMRPVAVAKKQNRKKYLFVFIFVWVHLRCTMCPNASERTRLPYIEKLNEELKYLAHT